MANYGCENRISDDEIISSLEVIATTRNCSECKIRNCNWGDCNCSQITANAALDLINRQKTEVERLQKEVNLVSILFQDLQERYEEAQTEIERLKGMFISQSKDPMDFCGVLCDYAEELTDKAKSEAYKEFAERLKDKASTVGVDEMYDGQPMYVSVEAINKLVKEMVGEEK